jgi:hypothetical protein
MDDGKGDDRHSTDRTSSHAGIMDPNGDVLQRVAEPGTFLFGPVWSPDRKWIASSRATTGRQADIFGRQADFVSRPDGRDAQQVTSTAANEITVEWGPRP